VTARRWSSSSPVARLVRKCLDEGTVVEIDGLGLFRPDGNGGFEFVPENRPQAFIAHAVEDAALVHRLGDDLDRHGIDPWIDTRKLLPGQNWPRAIQRAIEVSQFFLACLSPHSVSKRGRFQAELRYALDCSSLVPSDESYFIPVRFAPCQVPDEIARSFQWVDLFPDWDRGVRRIITSIRRQQRLRRRREQPPRAA
jgi:hypothetical protein